jgi:hypothetical protein
MPANFGLISDLPRVMGGQHDAEGPRSQLGADPNNHERDRQAQAQRADNRQRELR